MWIPYGEVYEVNGDTGLIRNSKTGRILNGWLHDDGRRRVKIYGKTQYLSRVLGLALLPRIIREGDEVDHLNYIKSDDRPCNLQWKSPSANQRNNRAENISVTTYHRNGTAYNYYLVQFNKNYKPIYSKLFKTLEEAVEARDAFKSSEEFRLSL